MVFLIGVTPFHYGLGVPPSLSLSLLFVVFSPPATHTLSSPSHPHGGVWVGVLTGDPLVFPFSLSPSLPSPSLPSPSLPDLLTLYLLTLRLHPLTPMGCVGGSNVCVGLVMVFVGVVG